MDGCRRRRVQHVDHANCLSGSALQYRGFIPSVGELNTLSDFAGNNATVGSSYDSSSVVALQNVEGSVTFRVIAWPGATTGSLGFEGTGNDIQIFGTATLVPEPGTLVLMATGLIALTASRRKIRRTA